ncbi:hypothetical protein KCP78_00385 [Salmonella enterica subsp. enterica]|nr:hypothetical protein KCP78_00385 [Salmonella enterica subsp. enterica]
MGVIFDVVRRTAVVCGGGRYRGVWTGATGITLYGCWATTSTEQILLPSAPASKCCRDIFRGLHALRWLWHFLTYYACHVDSRLLALITGCLKLTTTASQYGDRQKRQKKRMKTGRRRRQRFALRLKEFGATGG